VLVIFLRVLPITLVMLALLGCDQQQESPELSALPVKLMTLEEPNRSTIRQFPAHVEATVRSNLSFRMSGELLELNAIPGQQVSKGEVIARIDDRTALSELDSARSRLEFAEAMLKRMRYTYENGAASKSEFDESESEWRAARAVFDQAEEKLTHTQLRAPYDGVIAQVPVDNRQFVQVQQTVAVIQQPGKLDVVFYLPEQIVQRIPHTNGQIFSDEIAYEVRFSNSDNVYFASLASYTTQANAQSLTYEIKLTLLQPDDITVLDGMSANVRLDLSMLHSDPTKPHWFLPSAAVTYSGYAANQAHVWRYTVAEKIEAVPVQVGRLTAEGLEVSGDLMAGDRVVAIGAHRLKADTKVIPWIKEQGL